MTLLIVFIKKIFYTPINTFALKKFDYYCSITKNFTSMLIERGFNKNKIFTVYNGIDVDKENKLISKQDFLKKYSITYNEKNIYVGLCARLHSVKGIDVFLKASKELVNNKNILFLIAGNGEEKEKYLKYKKENNLDNLFFLGQIDIDEIFSFYNAIDINTLTSLSESFPYALLEGGLMKKSTIASKVGGIPEMIEDNKDGFLFLKGDYKDLSKKILVLSNDVELREKLGLNFYNKICQNFSSKKMGQLHLEIYKTVLKKIQEVKL